MAQDYYMSECPACKNPHHFAGSHGVPFYEPSLGASFQVDCPETGKRLEVTIPADVPPSGPKMTDLKCTTCGKAYYAVKTETKRGSTALLQRLECANPGCLHEHARVVSARTGKTIA